jgi:hypothetical protein
MGPFATNGDAALTPVKTNILPGVLELTVGA